jgi:polyisoprenoid-binding protein YceI
MTTTYQTTTTTWAIDAAHTNVEFSVRHLMIATVKGRFAGVKGTLVSPEETARGGELDITIDAASIDTREPQRDAHLRSADFFDVERFPTLRYRSRQVIPSGENRFRVIGDLTIRDVTREVVLDVTSHGTATDPWGGQRAGFEAAATIKRSEFGLTWNQALETGGVVVGDEIRINLDVELVRQS